MARYIDADRLRDRVKTETNPYGKPTLEYASGLKVLVMIDKEPTADVVEVVRCRDCVYSHFDSSSLRYSCHREWNRRHVEEDDFCNYGKPQKRSDAE